CRNANSCWRRSRRLRPTRCIPASERRKNSFVRNCRSGRPRRLTERNKDMKRVIWMLSCVLAVCSLGVSCDKPVLGCDYRLTVMWQERKSVTEPIPLQTAKVYAFFVSPDEWEVTSIENARAGI